jgi:hypothetical protein
MRVLRPCSIRLLALSTYPFVCGGGDHIPVNPDVVIITEIHEFLPSELSVIVGDDGARDLVGHHKTLHQHVK